MSDEDINSQINYKQNEITKCEETTIKKEAYLKNRTNEEFDPKIIEVESEIKAEQIKLNEVNKKIEQWNSKKKELQTIIKDLKKKYDNLKKEKNKYLNSPLKSFICLYHRFQVLLLSLFSVLHLLLDQSLLPFSYKREH